MNSLYNTQSESADNPLLIQGVWVEDLQEKANNLNNHFGNISRIDDPEGPLPEPGVYRNDIPTINSINVTPERVTKAIKRSKRKSAMGPDGLSNNVLKNCADSIAPFLARYFQKCINHGLMPSSWKTAHVVPVFEGGAKEDVANYRLISLLSCSSKLLERVVCDDLSSFLMENGHIGLQQFGFIKKSSTIDQLLELYHQIMSILDKQMLLKLFYLDISKAFDRVWTKGLIHKMKKMGVRGNLLKWFTSYLENRMQRVVLKGVFSVWSHIIAGVPQGSILGPILYLLYAEDVCEVIRCAIRTFADDTLLFSVGLTEKQCSKDIQPSLMASQEWARKWKINLNGKKTKCLTFARVGGLRYPLTLNYLFVEEVLLHRHLGLNLTFDGKWSQNLNIIAAKVTRRLCVLRRYSRRLHRRYLMAVYNTFILPIMEYGGIIMRNTTAGD